MTVEVGGATEAVPVIATEDGVIVSVGQALSSEVPKAVYEAAIAYRENERGRIDAALRGLAVKN